MDTSNYPLPVIDCSIATLEPVFTGIERRLDPAALKNLVIHPAFLRFFALQGDKIPRSSNIPACL